MLFKANRDCPIYWGYCTGTKEPDSSETKRIVTMPNQALRGPSMAHQVSFH